MLYFYCSICCRRIRYVFRNASRSRRFRLTRCSYFPLFCHYEFFVSLFIDLFILFARFHYGLFHLTVPFHAPFFHFLAAYCFVIYMLVRIRTGKLNKKYARLNSLHFHLTNPLSASPFNLLTSQSILRDIHNSKKTSVSKEINRYVRFHSFLFHLTYPFNASPFHLATIDSEYVLVVLMKKYISNFYVCFQRSSHPPKLSTISFILVYEIL